MCMNVLVQNARFEKEGVVEKEFKYIDSSRRDIGRIRFNLQCMRSRSTLEQCRSETTEIVRSPSSALLKQQGDAEGSVKGNQRPEEQGTI